MPDPPSDQPSPAPSRQAGSYPLYQGASYAAPASKSDDKIVTAVLITIGILVGFGVLALGAVGAGVWYLAKSIHTTPSASFTESELGVAIYPGAEPSLRGSRAEIAGKSILNATYYTSDPMEQVLAFYLLKAGPHARRTTTTRGSVFRISRSAGDFTTVQVSRIPNQPGGKTYIAIMRMANARAQR